MKNLGRFAPLIGAAVIVAACSVSTKEVTLDFAEPISRIEVTTGDGDVFVTGDEDATAVQVQATLSYSGDELEVDSEVSDGVLRLSHDCGDRDTCSVDYVIDVPETVEIMATSVDGDISVQAVDGAVAVDSSAGSITLRTLRGPVEARSVEGNVLGVRLESPTGSVATDSGDIDVAWENPVNELTVKSSTGNITVQVPGDPYSVVADTDSGSTDINIQTDANDPKTIQLDTGSGDITIYAS